METQERTILVTGATGQQGGAVSRHLLADGWRVRGLTRKPKSPQARAQEELGAEIVAGDLDDPASLRAALRDAYGVFSVQTFWEAGVEGEVRQGKALADAALAAGIEHFVYSSVGGAERQTGIPHFDSKWQVEEHIAGLGLPATVLRPVFFMENLGGFNRPERRDGVLTTSMALPPDRLLQMIAVDDIGGFAALAFADPSEFLGQAFELAGDELAMTRVAALLSHRLGEAVRYVELPIDQVRGRSEEVAVMFEWFDQHGYQADIPALRALYPGLTTFEAWLQTETATLLKPVQ